MLGTLLMGLFCLILIGIIGRLSWSEHQGVNSIAPRQIYRRDDGGPFHSTTIMIDEVNGKWCSYHYLTIDNTPIRCATPGEHSQRKIEIYRNFTQVSSHD